VLANRKVMSVEFATNTSVSPSTAPYYVIGDGGTVIITLGFKRTSGAHGADVLLDLYGVTADGSHERIAYDQLGAPTAGSALAYSVTLTGTLPLGKKLCAAYVTTDQPITLLSYNATIRAGNTNRATPMTVITGEGLTAGETMRFESRALVIGPPVESLEAVRGDSVDLEAKVKEYERQKRNLSYGYDLQRPGLRRHDPDAFMQVDEKDVLKRTGESPSAMSYT
jgi:hypothetical protein